MKKLSVVFPTHNRLAWLKESVESCLCSDVDLEMLILDNGSSDGTTEYLMDLGESDHRVRPYFEPDNVRGRYRFLAEVAEGELVNLFSDDDRQLAGGLKAKLDLFDLNPDLGLVFSPVRIIDANGLDHGIDGMGRVSPVDRASGALQLDPIMICDYVPTPTAIMKRESFKDLFYLLDEKTLPLCDWALWMEAAHRGIDAGFIARPTIQYRSHDTSDTKSYIRSKRYIDDHLAMYRHWSERGFQPSQAQLREIQRFMMNVVIMCEGDVLPALQELTSYYKLPASTLPFVSPV